MDDKTKMFWLQIRQGLLVIVGAIEPLLEIIPTTSDLRKQWRENLISRGTVSEQEERQRRG